MVMFHSYVSLPEGNIYSKYLRHLNVDHHTLFRQLGKHPPFGLMIFPMKTLFISICNHLYRNFSCHVLLQEDKLCSFLFCLRGYQSTDPFSDVGMSVEHSHPGYAHDRCDVPKLTQNTHQVMSLILLPSMGPIQK